MFVPSTREPQKIRVSEIIRGPITEIASGFVHRMRTLADSSEHYRPTRLYPAPSLGAASEEADDDAGGDPIVVLMKIRAAERGAVVVGIEQTDVNVPEWVDIQPSANFIVSAAPADLSVRARSPNQGFRKWSQTPSIAPTVEVANSEMISVEDILGAADGYGVVAGVRDDLQPRFYVPAERSHCAVYVGPSSAPTV